MTKRYERYHAEKSGSLTDAEAIEAALNSTDGVREVIHSEEPLESTLNKYIWRGNTGIVTTVDYYLEIEEPEEEE